MAAYHITWFEGRWKILKVVKSAETREELEQNVSNLFSESSEGNVKIYTHNKAGLIVDEHTYIKKGSDPSAFYVEPSDWSATDLGL